MNNTKDLKQHIRDLYTIVDISDRQADFYEWRHDEVLEQNERYRRLLEKEEHDWKVTMSQRIDAEADVNENLLKEIGVLKRKLGKVVATFSRGYSK